VAAVAAASASAPSVSAQRTQPSAAEVARTVAELAPSGTLSVVGADGWPLGVGARFVADAAGAPALCLAAAGVTVLDARSSFHVEVRECDSFLGGSECLWIAFADEYRVSSDMQLGALNRNY
jgi:hypothetical protein